MLLLTMTGHPKKRGPSCKSLADIFLDYPRKLTAIQNSRKADWRVFPMLCVVFGLSLLDRTNISAAYIAGLAKDLRLDIGSRYNIALLIFFIGMEPRTRVSHFN